MKTSQLTALLSNPLPSLAAQDGLMSSPALRSMITNRESARWPASTLGCLFSVLWCIVVCSAPVAQAAPPELMSYQGFLVDGNGNALGVSAPANYPVIFRLYDAVTGGALKWSEQQIVTVDKGSFSVQLGEGTAVGSETRTALSTVFSGANSTERYMELAVTINGTPVRLLPRLRMLPAPYAFLATSASSLVNSSGSNLVSASSSGSGITVNGPITGNGSGLTGLTASQIPALDASKITSGALNVSRIPGLDAGQIITGTFLASRIPNLDASKITTGSMDASRIGGTLGASQIPQNLVTHNFSGNVGIGTLDPGTNKLQVIGNIRLGTGGTNYATSGEENLRIVRGEVSSGGTIFRGSGFTVSGPDSSHLYTVTFNTPFSGTPVVTASGFHVSSTRPALVTYRNISANIIEFVTWDGTDRADREFSFIAIGPR